MSYTAHTHSTYNSKRSKTSTPGRDVKGDHQHALHNLLLSLWDTSYKTATHFGLGVVLVSAGHPLYTMDHAFPSEPCHSLVFLLHVSTTLVVMMTHLFVFTFTCAHSNFCVDKQCLQASFPSYYTCDIMLATLRVALSVTWSQRTAPTRKRTARDDPRWMWGCTGTLRFVQCTLKCINTGHRNGSANKNSSQNIEPQSRSVRGACVARY